MENFFYLESKPSFPLPTQMFQRCQSRKVGFRFLPNQQVIAILKEGCQFNLSQSSAASKSFDMGKAFDAVWNHLLNKWYLYSAFRELLDETRFPVTKTKGDGPSHGYLPGDFLPISEKTDQERQLLSRRRYCLHICYFLVL